MQLTSFENYTPGEEEAIARLVNMLEHKMLRETSPPDIKRDAHPKQIALLKGEFTVAPSLADELKVGVFKETKSYPCWIRFSNQNAPQKADSVKDIRGVAIKLMQVEGEKILENEKDEQTQDFILISTSYFVTKNIAGFAKLIHALVSGNLRLLLFFMFNPRVAYNLITSGKNFGSLLEARFWSVSPYLYGSKAVKYSLKPCTEQQTPIPPKPSYNYLSEVMTLQLRENDYFFDFMVQFQKDPVTMPVEDLSKAWPETESPFIKVATLKIPRQEFGSEEQKAFGENLSFTPWHSLREHRPLGNINRGRRIVYEKLSVFRHKLNNAPRQEPVDFSLTHKTNSV